MELPSALQKKMVDLLTSLPRMNQESGQKDLLAKAGVDAPLRNVIPLGKPAAMFVPLLIRRLADHGRLNDGRQALEALLEAAKDLITDPRKQKDCEKLLANVRTLIQEEKADAQTQPQTAPLPSTNSYVQLLFDRAQTVDQRLRKDLISALASLLELDKQFVRMLPNQAGNGDMIIRLPEDKAKALVVLFQTKNKKLTPICQQFAVTSIVILNPLRSVALLSDTKLLPEAQKFVEQFLAQHPQVTDRRNQISPTQIKGLENVLLSADTTDLLKQYMSRQKAKAQRNENPHIKNKEYHLARFYEQLEQKVKALEEFVSQQNTLFPDANLPAQAQGYRYHLVKEFLQHLIIEYMFRVQSQ